MSRIPRTKLIDPDRVRVYHCFNRTAQGLYLCGQDKVSGEDYSHRKQWFMDRLIYLAHLFVIDIGVHAILSTHFHLILRNRPDLGRALSDREVIVRWHELFPGRRDPDGRRRPLSEAEMETRLKNPSHTAKLRRRLSDISWFMKALQEHIARRANADSGKSGHFFGGRFESVRLIDEEALIACAVYVDLNEVRAKVADLPENSRFSSVWQRLDGLQCRLGDPGFLADDLPEGIRFGEGDLEDEDAFQDESPPVSLFGGESGEHVAGTIDSLSDCVSDSSADTGCELSEETHRPIPARREGRGECERVLGAHSARMRRARKLGTARPGDRDYWLSPIDESVALPCLGLRGREVEFKAEVSATTRLNRGGWLPMSMEQYLRVLDWTGRQIRRDKRGAIPPDIAPLLERLGVDVDGWCELALNFRRLFSYAAGVASRMEEFAVEIGQRWFRSTRNSRRIFKRK